jgi:hypothetical protein
MARFFQSGAQELSSNRWMSQHQGDRPSFQADISRGLFSSGHFQVFSMPQGLLCLEMRHKDYGNLGQHGHNVGAAWFMFGAIGGIAAGLAAARDNQRYGGAPAQRWEASFDTMQEDELLELARERKKSFVCKLDEITSARIDAPSGLSNLIGDGSLAGIIRLRDRAIGKIVMQVRDQTHLAVAVDALARRLGDRAQIHVAFDDRLRRFVRRR